MLNVHSLSTQKMPTSSELTYSLHDVVKVPGTSCTLLWVRSPVCSLAKQFTQVDNQWQYDLHGATSSSHTRKVKQTVADVERTFTVYPENADIRWTYRLPSWQPL